MNNCIENENEKPAEDTGIPSGNGEAPDHDQAVRQARENILSQTWFIILMLMVFCPVGLYLMWSRKKFTKPVRMLVTVMVIGMFSIGMLMPA